MRDKAQVCFTLVIVRLKVTMGRQFNLNNIGVFDRDHCIIGEVVIIDNMIEHVDFIRFWIF